MLDIVALRVKAGDGGRGAVTFRHEKFVPFGGPFGGDGGKGGDVIVVADESASSLRAYQRRRNYKAENGGNGMTKNKHGADAPDLKLAVPPGTLVFLRSEDRQEELLADLEASGQQIVVAHGGKGGYGNLHFATPTNQAPRIAQPGIQGQEKTIVLEMRLIADVGIIGYPNVGKSSLLAAISAANPKIADYPFTTLEPILGVVNVGRESFVVAEIPGLIEGAHHGKGLGIEFLRHAMRTKLFIHLIDGRSANPVEDMIKLNNELAMFDASLAKRPQAVAVNKIDLPEVKEREEEIKAAFADADIRPMFVSAAAKIGLDELIAETWKRLKAANIRERVIEPPPKIFRPQAVEAGAKVSRKGGSYIIVDPALERLLDKLDLEDPDELKEFNENLEKLGINKLLKSAGAKPGDTVMTGNMEWEWFDENETRRNRRHV